MVRLKRADAVAAMRHVHGEHLSLSYARTPASGIRYSCTVSKKIAVRATERNTIKRRCREAVRASLPASGSFVLICKAKNAARTASYSALKKDVEELLRKAGISD